MSATNWEDVYRVQTARIAELERENDAVRAALATAEVGLEHALMMQPCDPFKRGKIITAALDSVRAARKEAQP